MLYAFQGVVLCNFPRSFPETCAGIDYDDLPGEDDRLRLSRSWSPPTQRSNYFGVAIVFADVTSHVQGPLSAGPCSKFLKTSRFLRQRDCPRQASLQVIALVPRPRADPASSDKQLLRAITLAPGFEWIWQRAPACFSP